MNDDGGWEKGDLWMARQLAATKMRWNRRQPRHFWQRRLGILLVVDVGLGDDQTARNDRQLFQNQGVLVVRVREMNESDASDALRAVELTEPWSNRRHALGLRSLDGGR